MSQFDYFPDFDLGGARLRQIRESDAEAYQKYMNQPEVTEFLTQENIPISYDRALSDLRYWGGLFAAKRSFYWAIAISATDELIGTVGYNMWHRSHGRGEVSYDLAPAFWGHGIMFHSLQKIMSFGEAVMGLSRIQATVVVSNARSIKLLERCGFKQEGRMEKYEIVGADLKDYYMYGRVKI